MVVNGDSKNKNAITIVKEKVLLGISTVLLIDPNSIHYPVTPRFNNLKASRHRLHSLVLLYRSQIGFA